MLWAIAAYLAIAVVMFGAFMWDDMKAPDMPGIRMGTGGCAFAALFWIVFVLVWIFEKDEGSNP